MHVDGCDQSTATTTPVSVLDADSRRWMTDLQSVGPRRADAIAKLHAVLLRAARFEVARRLTAGSPLSRQQGDELAGEAAHDALQAVLTRLHTFRGESRFTTWAYKFALLEAGVKVRRAHWAAREVALPAETTAPLVALGPSPQDDAEAAALLAMLQRAIVESLTSHQRQVLVALTLQDVPIDVLAERMVTTRGALYKTLHDARRSLRRCIDSSGFPLDAWLEREGV